MLLRPKAWEELAIARLSPPAARAPAPMAVEPKALASAFVPKAEPENVAEL